MTKTETTPTRPRWPSPARSPSGPATTACARSGPTRRATSARTSRRCPRTRATSAVGGGGGAPETVAGPPDWRGLLDLLEAHSAASFDDLWRTWVARDTDLAAARRAGGRPGTTTTRSSRRPGTGSCRAPSATRCAPGSSTRRPTLLDDARTILDQRAAIATAAAAAGLTVPTTLRTAFESPDGFASADARGDRRARGDPALRRRGGGPIPTSPTRSSGSGCGGRRPTRELGQRPDPVRGRRPGRVGDGGRLGAVDLDGRRRGRAGPGRQPRHRSCSSLLLGGHPRDRLAARASSARACRP